MICICRLAVPLYHALLADCFPLEHILDQSEGGASQIATTSKVDWHQELDTRVIARKTTLDSTFT